MKAKDLIDKLKVHPEADVLLEEKTAYGTSLGNTDMQSAQYIRDKNYNDVEYFILRSRELYEDEK